uniref:Uncharacterized protein n=1 Tax=Siphoviridae sp. ct3r22 TaxID=2825325 RepID=A0A8S5V0X2_9CAUD|nr:MAG TPA: hypothetical protein [Siphoviridae sp. ct3r22]
MKKRYYRMKILTNFFGDLSKVKHLKNGKSKTIL